MKFAQLEQAELEKQQEKMQRGEGDLAVGDRMCHRLCTPKQERWIVQVFRFLLAVVEGLVMMRKAVMAKQNALQIEWNKLSIGSREVMMLDAIKTIATMETEKIPIIKRKE